MATRVVFAMIAEEVAMPGSRSGARMLFVVVGGRLDMTMRAAVT